VAGLVHLRRATDVERTHGELRARLTDRLRGDNADSLADVDRGAAGKVTTIALGADALFGLTHQRRADPRSLRAGFLDQLDRGFVQQIAVGGNDVAIAILQVFSQGAAQDTLAERGDRRATLHDRAHFQRAFGAAILDHDDAVLRHVDETAGQVTRVCRLERGIG